MIPALLVVLAAGVALAVRQSPLPWARTAAGVALIATGLGLAALRQFHLAVPIGLIGLGLLRQARAQARATPAPGGRSTVRTAALAMELDHDSGEMDGEVLAGRFAGSRLSELGPGDLDSLADELADDPDSLGLLRAYLDRRRDPEDAPPPPPSPPGGEMSEAEAYRILGLSPQAGPEAVRAAHRRLIKKLHPDGGGSDALAAMINAAKARLER